MTDFTFETLGLAPELCAAVQSLGFTTPTPIQQRAIPALLSGVDVMASAQTGTGKTAAFMLPALNMLAKPPVAPGKGPRVLVLTPTRELAAQVTKAAQDYGRNLRKVKIVSIVGGESYHIQNKAISQPFDILVATPGRLIDHLDRGKLDFSRLELLVLDEADRMLDMGFVDAVESIARVTPAARQTALFSATLDGLVGQLASELLKEPELIQTSTAKDKHQNIEQRLHYVDDMAHKQRLLMHLLDDAEVRQAIIFTATKRDADDLADILSNEGQRAGALHGDMQQRQRNRTLEQLRRGQLRVLVATDVAARGIDINGISHVFNFDLPKFAEDYVHRIGRTGRAGASGIAISFASMRDQIALRKIEKLTGKPIPNSEIAGFEPRSKIRHGMPSSGGRDGGRGGFGGKREGGRGGYGNDRRPQGDRPRQGGFGGGRDGAPAGRGFYGDRDGGQGRGGFGGSRGADQGSPFARDSRPAQPRWSDDSRPAFPARDRDTRAGHRWDDSAPREARPTANRWDDNSPRRDAPPAARSFGNPNAPQSQPRRAQSAFDAPRSVSTKPHARESHGGRGAPAGRGFGGGKPSAFGSKPTGAGKKRDY